jgi:hypothetical protein
MKPYSIISVGNKKAISFNNMEYSEAPLEIKSALEKIYKLNSYKIIDGLEGPVHTFNIEGQEYSLYHQSYGTFLISLSEEGNSLLNPICEKIGAFF